MLQDDERPESRRVGTVLESVVADLGESHDEATTQLYSTEAPPPTDTATFRLVVSEFVGNAARHGNDSSEVEIETMPSTVNDKTRITVRDDGESLFQHSHGIGLCLWIWLVNCGVRQLGDGSSLNGLPMAELPYTFFTTRARLTVTGIYAETADAFSIRLRSSFETLGSPRGTRGQHAGEP